MRFWCIVGRRDVATACLMPTVGRVRSILIELEYIKRIPGSGTVCFVARWHQGGRVRILAYRHQLPSTYTSHCFYV